MSHKPRTTPVRLKTKTAASTAPDDTQQVGVSPKLIAALLTSLATFLLTKLALPWNPIVEQAINAAAPIIAAYLARPGRVRVR